MANTLYVGSDQEYTSIQAAIEAAQNGDTIVLKENVTSTGSISIVDKNITVDLGGFTLDAQVYIKNASDVEFKNGSMTYTNTNPSFGSAVITTGIYTDENGKTFSSGGAAALTLTGVNIYGGEAVDSYNYTHAVYYKSTGGLTITDCTVTGGTATRTENSTISRTENNTAHGIYASNCDGDIVIKNSTISGGYGNSEGETRINAGHPVGGGDAIHLSGKSNVTIEDSTVSGGSSKWYNANTGINVTNQFSGTLTVVDSTVTGGTAEGKNPSSSTSGIGGVGIYTNMSTSCKEIAITGSTISGGDGGMSWNGSGIEYRNANIKLTITGSTVEAGNGENASATGSIGALMIANSTSTQIVLDDVKLNGEGNGNAVIKGGDKGVTFVGPVEVVGGTLENVKVSVDATGIEGTQAIISGNVGESVEVTVTGNENAAVIVEGGKTYITTETDPAAADTSVIYVNNAWADAAENQLVGVGKFLGVNAFADVNEAEAVAEAGAAKMVIADGADVTYTKDQYYFLNTNPNEGGENNAFDNVVDAEKTYDMEINGTFRAYQILLNNAETTVSATGKAFAAGEAFRVMGGTLTVQGSRAEDAGAPEEIFTGSWGGGVNAGADAQISAGYFMVDQEAEVSYDDTVIFVSAGIFSVDNALADFDNSYIYLGSIGTYQDVQLNFTNGADVTFANNTTVINDKAFGMDMVVDAGSTVTISDSEIMDLDTVRNTGSIVLTGDATLKAADLFSGSVITIEDLAAGDAREVTVSLTPEGQTSGKTITISVAKDATSATAYITDFADGKYTCMLIDSGNSELRGEIELKNGSISMDATSTIVADSYAGNKAITVTIDVESFDGANKIIDLAEASDDLTINYVDKEGNALTADDLKAAGITEYKLADGDVVLANVDLSKLYVSSEYAGKEFGADLGDGKFFGLNAFADFDSAVAILPDNNSTIYLFSDAEMTAASSYKLNVVSGDGENHTLKIDSIIDVDAEFAKEINIDADLFMAYYNNHKVVVNGDLKGGFYNYTGSMTFNNSKITDSYDNSNIGGVVTINGDGTWTMENAQAENLKFINVGRSDWLGQGILNLNDTVVKAIQYSVDSNSADAKSQINVKDSTLATVLNDGGFGNLVIGTNGEVNITDSNLIVVGTLTNNGALNIDGDSSVNVKTLNGVANVKGGTLTDSFVGGVVAVTGDTTFEGTNEFSKIWVSGGTLTVDGDLVTKAPYPAFFVIGNDEKVNATEKGFYNGFTGTEAGTLIVNGSYTAEEGVVSNGGKLIVNGEMNANCLYFRGGETIVAEGGILSGCVWGGVDAGASLVVDGGTFSTKKADGMGSFSNAGTFTVKGSSTLDIVDFASGTLTVEAGTTLTDSTVAGKGVVQFAADSTTTFEGENKITAALDNSVAGFDFVVNEGASLLITRYTLGYDRNITVKGTIEDATALETLDGVTLSLKADSPSGFSIGGWGTSVLDVDNAYVDLGSSSWKNATGTYTWNFTNSYVKAASFGNNNPAGSNSASWDITFDDSVLSANYIKNSAGVTTSFTNGSVATAGSIRIEGVLDIDETSKVVVTSYQNNKLGSQDEHGDISGTLNIAGELSIKGTGPVELYGAEVNVRNGGTLNLVNDNGTRLDVLVDADSELNIDGNFTAGTITNNGSITVDATSSFIANTLTGEGSITIDAAGFTEGINKVIDLNETASREGKVTISGLEEGTSVYYLADGDVILANADLEKLYFSSEYAEANFGDKVGEGRFFGINAFAEFTDNGTNNDKGWSNLLILPEATSEIVLAAGSDVSYGMLRPTQNITVKTEGEGYAVIDRFVNMGSDLTFAEGSKIKVIGNVGLSGANNQGGTVTINGEVYMAIAPSNGNKALYLWGMNDTPGQLVINAGGILKADCANVENHGTITVYGTMELGEQGDAPKLAGVGANNNGGWHGHLIVDGKDGEGIVSVAHNQLNFGGGNTSVPWQEPAGDCSVDILNGGKITTAAVSFRNGAKNTLTINKGTLEFTNDPDYAELTPRYFDNQGVINLTDGTLDMSDRDFNNAGTITVTGESTVKVGKVSGDGWINMDSVTLNDETDIEGGKVRFVNGESTLTGATVNANAFQVGFGGYLAKDERENVADIVVNVTNNSYIHTADIDYNGWVGTGWFESDADKAAAMTDARYTLNIENSVAEFGYFHVSTDGILNVTGNADEKKTYTGVSYSYYGGRTMINGVATFDNVDALVLYTNVSCDNGTETPGKLVIQNGANYVSWLDSSSTIDSFKISKTGIVEVDNATLDARHGTLLDTADATLTIKNNGVFKGNVVTNNGTITVDGSLFTAATVTNNGTVSVSGKSTVQIETLSGTYIKFTNAELIGNSNIGGNARTYEEFVLSGTLTVKQTNFYGKTTVKDGAVLNGSTTIVSGGSDFTLENGGEINSRFFNVVGTANIAGEINLVHSDPRQKLLQLHEGGVATIAETAVITIDGHNAIVNAGGTLNVNGTLNITKWAGANNEAPERGGNLYNEGTVVLSEKAKVTMTTYTSENGIFEINVTDGWRGVATVVDAVAGTFSADDITINAADAADGLTYRIDEATGDLVIFNLETDTVYVDDDWAGTASGTDLGEGKFYGYNAFADVASALQSATADTTTIKVVEGTSAELWTFAIDKKIEAFNENGLLVDMGQNGVSVNNNGESTVNGEVVEDDYTPSSAILGGVTIGEKVKVIADQLFVDPYSVARVEGELDINGAYLYGGVVEAAGTVTVNDNFAMQGGYGSQTKLIVEEGGTFTAPNVYGTADTFISIDGTMEVETITAGDVTVGNNGAFTFKKATVGDLNVTTKFEVKEASLTAETMSLYSNLVIDGLQASDEAREVTLSVIPVGKTEGFTVKMKVAKGATSAVYEGTEIPDGEYDFTVFDGTESISVKGVSVSGGSFSVADSTIDLGTLNGNASITGTTNVMIDNLNGNIDAADAAISGSISSTGDSVVNVTGKSSFDAAVSGARLIFGSLDKAVAGSVDVTKLDQVDFTVQNGTLDITGTMDAEDFGLAPMLIGGFYNNNNQDVRGEAAMGSTTVNVKEDAYVKAHQVYISETGAENIHTLNVYGELHADRSIYNKANGQLNVYGDVSANYLQVAGDVTVSGENAKLTLTGDGSNGAAKIGLADGSSTLTVKEGALVSTAGTIYVGYNNGERYGEMIVNAATVRAGNLTVDANSTVELTEALIEVNALNINEGAKFNINDLASTVSFGDLSNAGTITIDATGAAADMIKVLDYTGSADLALEDFGTVSVVNGDYTTIVRDNDLYIVTGAYSETDVMVNTEWTDAAFGEKVAEGRFFGINAFGSLNDVAADATLTKVTFTGKEEISDLEFLEFAASAFEFVFQSAEFTGDLSLKGAELSIDADSKIIGTITANTGLHVYGDGTIGDVTGAGRFDGEFITAGSISGFSTVNTDELKAAAITLTNGSDTLNVKENLTVEGAIYFGTGIIDEMVLAENATVTAGVIDTIGAMSVTIDLGGAYKGEAAITVAENGIFESEELVLNLDLVNATLGDTNILVSGITKFKGTLVYSNVEYALGDTLKFADKDYTITLDSENKALVLKASVKNDIDGNGYSDIIMLNNAGYSGAWLTQGNGSEVVWADLADKAENIELLGMGKANGSAALFFRNTDNNYVGAWTLKGGKVTGYTDIHTFNPSAEVIGLGDFNGDGATDVLLRDNNVVGAHITDTGWTEYQGLGDNWEITAVGDFNGDGKDDIVLVDKQKNNSGMWLMRTEPNDDGKLFDWSNLDELSDGLEIVGAGDVNGDGCDDVLISKGEWLGAWIIEDGVLTGFRSISDKYAGTIEGVGDFNGDYIDDIQIRVDDDAIGYLVISDEGNAKWQQLGQDGLDSTDWTTKFSAIC